MKDHLRGEKNGRKFGVKWNIAVKNVKKLRWEKLKIIKKNYNIDSIIEMAWCDKTSFDSIKAQTGIPEKGVIKIMRSNLKKTSFKVWRERVYGRKAKHAKK